MADNVVIPSQSFARNRQLHRRRRFFSLLLAVAAALPLAAGDLAFAVASAESGSQSGDAPTLKPDPSPSAPEEDPFEAGGGQATTDEDEDLPIAGILEIPEVTKTQSLAPAAAVPDRPEYLMPIEPGFNLGRNGRYAAYKYTDATPWNWASPLCSVTTADGGSNLRITSACTTGKLRTTVINTATKDVVSTKEVNLSGALPIVGGIDIMSDGNIYVVTGANNPDKRDNVEVLRVSKYDKALNLRGSVGITSGNAHPGQLPGVVRPFEAGSLRMALAGGTLFIHTSRLMYNEHQSNMTLKLNAVSMTDFKPANVFYVSHSFNQWIWASGNELVAVDHGDAYPRSIVLRKTSSTDPTTQRSYPLQEIVGSTGDNFTATTASGFAVTGRTANVIGISTPQNYPVQGITGVRKNRAEQYTSNLFIATHNLDSRATTFNWITNNNPTSSNTIISQPTLTALKDGSLVVLYYTVKPGTFQRTLEYRVINAGGQTLASASYPGLAYFPSSPPVQVGSNLYWVSAPQLDEPLATRGTVCEPEGGDWVCKPGELPGADGHGEQYLMGLDLSNPRAPRILKKEPLSASAPILSGNPVVGQTLTGTNVGPSAFTPAASKVTYQWLRDGQPIKGATSSSYKLVEADAARVIALRVTGTRSGWLSATTTSSGVNVTGLMVVPTPTIKGNPRVGATLTVAGADAKDFKPSAASVTYQWLRNGNPISGATAKTYRIASADRGTRISVRVTGTKPGYKADPKTSSSVRIIEIDRLAGPDRYATNYAVNVKEMVAGKPVFVATGRAFPDALSIGPAVAKTGGSLVLARANTVDSTTLTLIKARKPSAVYVIGGTSAVSNQVANQVGTAAGVVPQRVGGSNRYETSAEIYTKFFSTSTISGAFVATGADYPDALSASAAGGTLNMPVLLVPGKNPKGALHPSTASSLNAKGVKNLVLVGGSTVITNQVASNLQRQGNFTTTRQAGSNRYGTNMQVNSYVNQRKGGEKSISGVWIATGKNFPDALSAGGPAGNPGQRLVLSNGNCIPNPVVSTWINGSGATVNQVQLTGGTTVLAPSVQNLTECK